MRLLFLTETVPHPLDSGGRIKTRHTLEALAERHAVACHTFIRDPAQFAPAREALEAICDEVWLHLVPRRVTTDILHLARSLATGRPLTVDRHFSRRVLSVLRERTRLVRYDAVYCDHLSMLEYGRRLGLPVLHDAHNVEHEIVRRYARTAPRAWLRAAAAVEWRALRRYEQREYTACDLITAVSEHDAGRIRTLAGPRVRVEAIPIGVAAAETVPAPRVREPRVLFVGGLAWPPNADAVNFLLREIWPAVLADAPDALLTVVGRGTPPVAPGQARGVRFAGYVEAVAPHFEASRLMVAPLRSGSGLRVKILEAFAHGVPVVSTTIGAEGLQVIDGEHLLIADTPSTFARAIVRLLHDDDLVERLATRARRLAVEAYDRAVVGRQTLEAVERWARSRRGES